MNISRIILSVLITGAILLPEITYAQKDDANTFPLDNFYAEIKNRPRSIFKNIRFGFSTGYGSTSFRHEFKGYGIYQPMGQAPSIFPSNGTPPPNYFDWVNRTRQDNTPFDPAGFQVSSDTTKLGFKGSAYNIPLKLTIHYEFMKRYRVGVGYSYEFMALGNFTPTYYGDRLSGFKPPDWTGWMSKYFGMIGVSFYRIDNYLFTADLQAGGFNPGANFESSQVKPVAFANLGITIERELSEYFRVFARPSYEVKSYYMDPGGGAPGIRHNMNAGYITIGISYSIPELPKCFIHDCKIQMNHAHGDREYRSRVHPIFKKQNPQYGENHPKLIKYKGKNKKKLNPY